MGKGLCQVGIRIMRRLINKIRYLILKFILPKEQFYIQGDGGFHSVFHPIMKPLLDRTGDIDGDSYENNNE